MRKSIKSNWFPVVIIMVCFIIGCNKNEEHKNIQQENAIEFVLNNLLSSEDHISYNGISPKEGFVPNAEIAVQIANVILSELYETDKIKNQQPFSVNIENNVWIIEGNLNKEFKGGVAYIEIDKMTGEVLKVYHGKQMFSIFGLQETPSM